MSDFWKDKVEHISLFLSFGSGPLHRGPALCNRRGQAWPGVGAGVSQYSLQMWIWTANTYIQYRNAHLPEDINHITCGQFLSEISETKVLFLSLFSPCLAFKFS